MILFIINCNYIYVQLFVASSAAFHGCCHIINRYIINRSRSSLQSLVWSWDQRWSDSDQTLRYESSKATSQHTTSPQFPLVWSLMKQRLQPSRVRSIVIALWGNLVCHLWILSIVGTHSFELPGQLHAEQRHIYWNHLSTRSFIILMWSVQLVLVQNIHQPTFCNSTAVLF